ncbi:MAG: 1-deoxy-D-xylulose-5-phosphate reductoisomerase [Bacteroidales bacterium]|nr:1-deoxy-D-xylulose-5-phosphate reductoisomerase [Bacteroidales bacterium]MDD3961118.1 1-deoxy-D-xylulose-5-phosphate reductoisomerase [Bacteroidales bacterium]MDY0284933.1 1-deoxy-D-xylulose-5-phosphate reductoisomerase [Bacteroidales bacterium]HPE85901.1 1-deoxy-D-xylulose-5-phosphate reductoisomerase [Bacteroidales bacterium]
MQKKHIAVLGSTGSIGVQTLDVIRMNPNLLTAEVLTAHNNATLLIAQAIEFLPNVVVITNEDKYHQVKKALSEYPVKVYAGYPALAQITDMETVDLVVTAVVGSVGLEPTLAAIEAGKPVAIANKETLVVAGKLITESARRKGVNLYPIDSEHSAIAQCIAGEHQNKIKKILLTASGGPFRGFSYQQLQAVTPEQALKHPTWNMGAKISIDSASMMNKGLEVIEAHWLFNVAPENIQVVLHPQSIIHSMVEFFDGSVKAQLGDPDMRVPIQYALTYPARIAANFTNFNIFDHSPLTFEIPDTKNFRNLALAFEALHKGGNSPCILNAANEVAVDAFLNRKIPFTGIPELIEFCLENVSFIDNPSFTALLETDKETRIVATKKIN